MFACVLVLVFAVVFVPFFHFSCWIHFVFAEKTGHFRSSGKQRARREPAANNKRARRRAGGRRQQGGEGGRVNHGEGWFNEVFSIYSVTVSAPLVKSRRDGRLWALLNFTLFNENLV